MRTEMTRTVVVLYLVAAALPAFRRVRTRAAARYL
jgi:hypothetical protein